MKKYYNYNILIYNNNNIYLEYKKYLFDVDKHLS